LGYSPAAAEWPGHVVIRLKEVIRDTVKKFNLPWPAKNGSQLRIQEESGVRVSRSGISSKFCVGRWMGGLGGLGGRAGSWIGSIIFTSTMRRHSKI